MAQHDAKRIRLRYADACRVCRAALEVGDVAVYSRSTKQVRCLSCSDARLPEQRGSDDRAVAPGVGGASARREHERRAAKRDRRIPGSVTNIDHIAVSAAGVFVIDAKHYSGRPSLRVEGGLLRPRTETLMVGSRDCTKLVAGMRKQIAVVCAALPADVSAGVVRGMLCFVEADWLFGRSFTIEGIHVLWPKKATTLPNRIARNRGELSRGRTRRRTC